MTKWKNFQIRALSALVAVAIVWGLFAGLNILGLKLLAIFGAVMAAFETTKILFKDESSFSLRAVFFVIALAIFGTSINALSFGTIAFTFATIIFIIFVLLQKNRILPLEQLLIIHGKGALGFFYAGILPAFCYKILDQDDGGSWFVFLLATVLCGDTMAYIVGVLTGAHKIMPSVSPKKSWEGSAGGVFGSLLAGGICWHFLFSSHNLTPFLILSVFAGIAGQFGDFFESLIKRVADVKDSGKIMPGHGCVLDRIDGLLFASPVILLGALVLSHFAL